MGVKEEKSRARTYVIETLVSILIFFIASFPHRSLFFASDVLNFFVDQTDYNVNYNQYLKGDFAPVSKEHTSILLVPTSGRLPTDLEGLFVRIGPNPLVGALHSSRGHMLFDGEDPPHHFTPRSQFILLNPHSFSLSACLLLLYVIESANSIVLARLDQVL